MSSPIVSSHYTGKLGRDYYHHRISRRTQDVQQYTARIFQRYIRKSDIVLDFGCGTGGILSSLDCAHRLGVEINEASVDDARSAGIVVYADAHDVPSASVDVVITHHALEHVPDPMACLFQLLRVVKPGGIIIVVVPAEAPGARRFRTWRAVKDLHLYSWNPLSLGNLMAEAGFTIDSARILSAGYSRFNRWLLRVPMFFRVAEKACAFALGRFNTICIARKSPEAYSSE